MRRSEQAILIVSFIAFSWLAMQVVHEFGHVLGARASGGVVSGVVLHPLAFSRTDLLENPHPLFAVWAGPVVGALVPVLLWVLARLAGLPGLYLFRFFAGFCLLANGVYIGGGAFGGLADAGEMMGHGSPRWLLVLFGLIAAPAGLLLWNGLGPYFGLGKANGSVDRRAVAVAAVLLIVLVGIELALCPVM